MSNCWKSHAVAHMILSNKRILANPIDRFSRFEAHMQAGKAKVSLFKWALGSLTRVFVAHSQQSVDIDDGSGQNLDL